MSRRRTQYIARRLSLLELEADVQRASLAATLTRWERRRALGWAADGAHALLRALASPRMRWLLIAAALRTLKRKA